MTNQEKAEILHLLSGIFFDLKDISSDCVETQKEVRQICRDRKNQINDLLYKMGYDHLIHD